MVQIVSYDNKAETILQKMIAQTIHVRKEHLQLVSQQGTPRDACVTLAENAVTSAAIMMRSRHALVDSAALRQSPACLNRVI